MSHNMNCRMESSWNDVPGGQTPTYCEAAPFTGSVEDALEFEGFKTPDEGYDTKMAPVLFCPAYASHNAFLAPHSLKTIIIKNLILMFQALCIFQEVWPPLSEREIEVREAYHGLEKQLCRIFDAVFKDPGQGWKKPGSIAPIIIGMYTKARRDERDSWGDNGSPPMASDREIALLHQLVDEWIRFSDTHVPLHPVNHNNDGDRTQLAQLRRVQLEYYVCDKFNISPLFSGMWPWIDEKKRKRRIAPPRHINAAFTKPQLMIKKIQNPKTKKSHTQTIEQGAEKFADQLGGLVNAADVVGPVFSLVARPKP